MKIVFSIILFFLITVYSQGDEPRRINEFFSPNGNFRLEMTDEGQGIWTIFERIPNSKKELTRYSIVDPVKSYKLAVRQDLEPGILWEFAGELNTMTILISNDGKRILVINDWPEDIEEGNHLILFFKNGLLMRTYSIQDLLFNKTDLSMSASHYFWLSRATNFKNIESEVLNIITTENMLLTFSTLTGEILNKQKLDYLSNDSIFVYGKAKKLDNNRYKMKVWHLVYGEIPNDCHVEFEYGQELKDDEFVSLIIEKGHVIKKMDIINTIFNQCHIIPSC